MKVHAKKQALKDILEWINSKYDIMHGGDTWIVSVTMLDTKEQRRLNRELGIHKLNMNKH